MSSDKHIITDLKYGDVENQTKILQGKVLTIIDAVIVDKNQNKSVKDLINSQFSERLNRVWQIAAGEWPSIIQDTGASTKGEGNITKK